LKRTYSGADSGKGAAYAWEGNKKAGQGRMEITDSTAPAKIDIQLDFIKPFKAQNLVEFRLANRGDATEVTWSMRGAMPYFFKLMTVFGSMDRMVGRDFETGLANLKRIAEQS
jgi:hypothetical protein